MASLELRSDVAVVAPVADVSYEKSQEPRGFRAWFEFSHLERASVLPQCLGVAVQVASIARAVGLGVELGMELGCPDRFAGQAKGLERTELARCQVGHSLRQAERPILAAELGSEQGGKRAEDRIEASRVGRPELECPTSVRSGS